VTHKISSTPADCRYLYPRVASAVPATSFTRPAQPIAGVLPSITVAMRCLIRMYPRITLLIPGALDDSPELVVLRDDSGLDRVRL
jgi:hypothetical protein